MITGPGPNSQITQWSFRQQSKPKRQFREPVCENGVFFELEVPSLAKQGDSEFTKPPTHENHSFLRTLLVSFQGKRSTFLEAKEGSKKGPFPFSSERKGDLLRKTLATCFLFLEGAAWNSFVAQPHTDREKFVSKINFRLYCRCRYRRESFWKSFFVQQMQTAVLGRFEGAAWHIRFILEIIRISEQKQV